MTLDQQLNKTLEELKQKYGGKTCEVQRACNSADWKTATAHDLPTVLPFAKVVITDVIKNAYGFFCVTIWGGKQYYLNPKNLVVIKEQEGA